MFGRVLVGRSRQAAAAAEEAVRLFRESGDRAAAVRAWRAAVRIFDDLSDPAAADLRRRLGADQYG